MRRTCGGNKQTQSFRFFPRAHYREYSKTLSRHKTGLFSRQNFSAGAHNPERETSFESSGIIAFSRARLFLKRFWREFKTSFRSHKPESRVCSRSSDGGERLPSFFFLPRQYFARALRSERPERASIFEGQAAKLQPRLSEEPGEEMIDLLAPVITLKMCPQFCEEGQVFYFAV